MSSVKHSVSGHSRPSQKVARELPPMGKVLRSQGPIHSVHHLQIDVQLLSLKQHNLSDGCKEAFFLSIVHKLQNKQEKVKKQKQEKHKEKTEIKK
jgi:hypothetical protein